MDSLALVESKSLRNEYLGKYTDDRALEVINKTKALVMAFWEGKNIATTKQLADFYGVDEDTVQKSSLRNKDEFLSDGLQVLRGKALRDAVDILSVASVKSSVLTIWTPRAALRLGMLLRDSDVAKQLRSLILDMVAIAPQQNDRIRELELQLEISRQNNQANQAALMSRELDHTMLTLHGKEVVLALRGLSEQVVKVETVVTEIVDVQKGNTQKVLTADQLKSEVQKRTGQKLKSQTDFVNALRKAGRDDLIVAVDRRVTGEYVIPDKLDEAIAIVYGKTRQKLIGE